jgi:hypothetical protein
MRTESVQHRRLGCPLAEIVFHWPAPTALPLRVIPPPPIQSVLEGAPTTTEEALIWRLLLRRLLRFR